MTAGSAADGYLRTAQTLVSVVVTAMAIVVTMGWFARNVAIVQLHPSFAPMQFNTALGFLITGVALFPNVARRNRVVACLGSAVAALGAATLLQYVIGVDLGIDELVVEPFTIVRTSDPGRMAPNTALCFVLSGVAFVALALEKRGLASAFGAIVLGLGLVSLFGYVSGVDAAYGWGDLTRMALHTSLGFVAVGIGMVIPLLDWTSDRPFNPIRAALVVGVLGGTSALTIWQALLAERSRDILSELETLVVRARIAESRKIEDTLTALERLALRSVSGSGDALAHDRWDADSRAYLAHLDQLDGILWFDDVRQSIWTTLRDDGEAAKETVERLREAAAKARPKGHGGSFDLSMVSLPRTGGRAMLAAIPVAHGESSRGVLAAEIDLASIFRPDPDGMLQSLVLRVDGNDGTVYQGESDTGGGLAEAYRAETGMDVGELHLTLTLIASEAFVDQRASRIAYVMLLGGGMITILLMATTLLAATSWQAREAYRFQYDRYRIVTNHVPAMIAAFDAAGRLTFANGPFENWINPVGGVELLGKDASILFGKLYNDLGPHLNAALAGDEADFDLTVHRDDADTRHLAVRIVPQATHSGIVANVYALMIDVTEQQQAEQKLKEHAARLDRFTLLAVGREEKMMSLKQEINQLLADRGEPSRYRIVESGDGPPDANS